MTDTATKRAARARQMRTGEHYTTALRHVIRWRSIMRRRQTLRDGGIAYVTSALREAGWTVHTVRYERALHLVLTRGAIRRVAAIAVTGEPDGRLHTGRADSTVAARVHRHAAVADAEAWFIAISGSDPERHTARWGSISWLVAALGRERSAWEAAHPDHDRDGLEIGLYVANLPDACP